MEWNGIWWNLTFHRATPVHVNSREIWSSVLQGKIYQRTHKNSNFTHIRDNILVQCDRRFAGTPHIIKLTQKTRAIMMSCHPLALTFRKMMALSSIIFSLCCLYQLYRVLCHGLPIRMFLLLHAVLWRLQAQLRMLIRGFASLVSPPKNIQQYTT